MSFKTKQWMEPETEAKQKITMNIGHDWGKGGGKGWRKGIEDNLMSLYKKVDLQCKLKFIVP